MSEPPFDVARAHRWFAVEFNNRAWDLIEQSSRSADEEDELLHAAHASLMHWRTIGTNLNFQRCENLLATAYLVAGRSEPALRHSLKCLVWSELNAAAGTETAFDRACALACAAKAHVLGGDAGEAERLSALAQAAADRLDADDRPVFEKLFGS